MFTRDSIRRLRAAAAVLGPGLLLLAGCAQKLTYERWELIREGDSAQDVQSILGEPMQRGNTSWLYFDGDRNITADIYFQDDKVTGKRWSDPKHSFSGGSPNVKQPGDAEELRYRKRK